MKKTFEFKLNKYQTFVCTLDVKKEQRFYKVETNSYYGAGKNKETYYYDLEKMKGKFVDACGNTTGWRKTICERN